MCIYLYINACNDDCFSDIFHFTVNTIEIQLKNLEHFSKLMSGNLLQASIMKAKLCSGDN